MVGHSSCSGPRLRGRTRKKMRAADVVPGPGGAWARPFRKRGLALRGSANPGDPFRRGDPETLTYFLAAAGPGQWYSANSAEDMRPAQALKAKGPVQQTPAAGR